jgi:uncharacterized protein YegJ (DUF2314 family)
MYKLKHLSVFVLAIVFFSCTGANQKTKEQISVSAEGFVSEYGLYFIEDDSISVEKFIESAHSWLPDFARVQQPPDSITSNGYLIARYTDLKSQYTPPDTSYMTYAGVGLSADEMLKLQNSKAVLVITFFGTTDNIIEKQKQIVNLMSDVAKGTKFILGDFSTIEFFNYNSWKANRVAKFIGNNVLNQIVMHTYREEEFCRVVTMGMDKFALPDLSIKDFSCRDQNVMSTLVNSVIATLIENPKIYADSTLLVEVENVKDPQMRLAVTSNLLENASMKAELRLKVVDPEPGDNPNMQFKIIFINPDFSTPQEEQTAVLGELFGHKDGITFASHDEDLLAASAKAKTRLPELKALFNKGLEPGYSILLKAPFKLNDTDNEWMWVEVTKWQGSSIEGILQNEPYEITDLRAGSKVVVSQLDIFDYILYKPDGSMEGNETGEIIEKQGN